MRLTRINLNTESIEDENITSDSKYFLLGGRGLSSQIVHDEVDPLCNPLGNKNKLIIASGLLTGSPFPNSSRTSVGAKSPLTNGIKEANVGGRPSIMLAVSGIRALVLDGIAQNLTLILIDQNEAKFESAKGYDRLGNYELHEKLRKKYGERIGIYSIGPAGEMMLKNSTVCANDLEGYPSRHAARGGLGAVMGSKKIKAIVIIPPKGSKVKFHDLKRFRELTKPFAQYLAESREVFSTYGTPLLMKAVSGYGAIPTKSFRKGSYEDIEKISGEKLHELVLARGGKKRIACCPTCAIKCSNIIVDENGNHITSSLEYETMALNGSNCLINDLDSLAKIDHLCDDIGIDTIEFGVTIGVAMDSGRIQWGDAEKVFKILEEIRKGTEIGKLYGNGVCHLGSEIGFERIPHVKGQGISGYDARVFKGMSVTYATSPMGADHTAGAVIAGRVARENRDYGELTENDHKLELSYEIQIFTTVLDSMGVCYFIGPSYRNMELVSKAINAMYGTNLSVDEIIGIGKAIIKNELEFNEKSGITQDMNDLPEFFRKEPSEPIKKTVTISKEDYKEFWKKLDE
ncbi:MAG: aldehyde ferredoxin oxidoreductase C-terminal domain-containing protein [Candidatus Hodarchaeota archaeon]